MNVKVRFTVWLVILFLIGSLAALLASKTAATGDLTTLSAADVSAYRWQAMAHFYAEHPKSRVDPTTPSFGVDLTTLSAADVSAYRWQAMARFYGEHPITQVRLTQQ